MKIIKAKIENDEVIVSLETPTELSLTLNPAHANWDYLRSLGYVNCRLAGEAKGGGITWHLPETDLEKLEVEIATYDYYYQMSDDSRVWHAGEAKDSRIATLTKIVGEQAYKDLWNQYCPYEELLKL